MCRESYEMIIQESFRQPDTTAVPSHLSLHQQKLSYQLHHVSSDYTSRVFRLHHVSSDYTSRVFRLHHVSSDYTSRVFRLHHVSSDYTSRVLRLHITCLQITRHVSSDYTSPDITFRGLTSCFLVSYERTPRTQQTL